MNLVLYSNIIDEYLKHDDVIAEFSVETEQLAFTIRPEMGEEDSFIIYPDPDIKVLERLRENKARTELWDDLPTELEYDMAERYL